MLGDCKREFFPGLTPCISVTNPTPWQDHSAFWTFSFIEMAFYTHTHTHPQKKKKKASSFCSCWPLQIASCIIGLRMHPGPDMLNGNLNASFIETANVENVLKTPRRWRGPLGSPGAEDCFSAAPYKFSSGLCKWRERGFGRFPQWSKEVWRIPPPPRLDRVSLAMTSSLHNKCILLMKHACPESIRSAASISHP